MAQWWWQSGKPKWCFFCFLLWGGGCVSSYAQGLFLVLLWWLLDHKQLLLLVYKTLFQWYSFKPLQNVYHGVRCCALLQLCYFQAPKTVPFPLARSLGVRVSLLPWTSNHNLLQLPLGISQFTFPEPVEYPQDSVLGNHFTPYLGCFYLFIYLFKSP